MSDQPKPYYLTTPIYYVNARPHIGHAYTTIVGDVLARRHRLMGEEVFYLTGTDEHGQKIERSAAAAGIPPQQFADQVSKTFSDLWKRMGITNDAFIRTTDPRHKQGAQYLFSELYKNGHIYLASYTGAYCVSDEAFVDAPIGAPCPDCGKLLEEVTEENFFFRLSAFQQPILDLIESGKLIITPDSARNEVLNFVRGSVISVIDELLDTNPLADVKYPHTRPKEDMDAAIAEGVKTNRLGLSAAGEPYVVGALRNLSISRSSFTWGIPVPEPAASESKQKHVIYVWLDALANYMTALGYGSEDDALWQKFWPADLHLVGKEITRFHCVYWPAFLLALNPAYKSVILSEGSQSHREPKPKDLEAASLTSNAGTIPTKASTPPQLSPAQHHEWAKKMVPRAITANGWLLFDNAKMSKSKGNVVRTETILYAFGTLCPPVPKTADITAATGISNGLQPTEPTPAKDEASAPEIASAMPPQGALAPEIDANSHQTGASAPEIDAAIPPKGALAPEIDTNFRQARALASEIASAIPPRGTLATEIASAMPPQGASTPEIGTNSRQPGASAPEIDSTNPPQGALAPEVRSPTSAERDLFATDILRYHLLREIPFGQDGNFSFDAMITRYNADLANGYGNLVSRTLAMIQQYFAGEYQSFKTDFYFDWVQNSGTANHLWLGFGDIEALRKDPGAQKRADNQEPGDSLSQAIETFIYDYQFSHATETLMQAVTVVDGYLTQNAPWKLAKQEDKRGKLAEVLMNAAEAIKYITACTYDVLPYATARVWAQLGLGDIELAARNGELKNLEWGGLKPGTKLGPLSPIFPRADKGLAQIMTDMENLTDSKLDISKLETEQIPATTDPAAGPRTATLEAQPGTLPVAGSTAHTTGPDHTPSHTEANPSGIFGGQPSATPTGPADSSPLIAIDDFIKVELRVAQVTVCERIPKADKLLRLEVDLGPIGTRQILSGIAEWYTPEDMVGRRIIVITNLAPRKMRGLESHGMLLAASEDGQKPFLATVPEGVPVGTRLK